MNQIRRNQTGNDELWINGENHSGPLLPVAASMLQGACSIVRALALDVFAALTTAMLRRWVVARPIVVIHA
ncbi:MAG: hypothetical protein WCA22_21445 [Candidatus Binatus sp.]